MHPAEMHREPKLRRRRIAEAQCVPLIEVYRLVLRD